MRIYYDTEFLDRDGVTVPLVSIGMVREDGKTYYAVNADMPWKDVLADDWMARNVVPSLPLVNRKGLEAFLAHPPNQYPRPTFELTELDRTDTTVKPKWVIANEVRDFIFDAATDDGMPELWAWYSAYDHLVLMQLWGALNARPKGIPMRTSDLKQEHKRLGEPKLPEQEEGKHNALADARHNLNVGEYLLLLANIGD